MMMAIWPRRAADARFKRFDDVAAACRDERKRQRRAEYCDETD